LVVNVDSIGWEVEQPVLDLFCVFELDVLNTTVAAA